MFVRIAVTTSIVTLIAGPGKVFSVEVVRFLARVTARCSMRGSTRPTNLIVVEIATTYGDRLMYRLREYGNWKRRVSVTDRRTLK